MRPVTLGDLRADLVNYRLQLIELIFGETFPKKAFDYLANCVLALVPGKRGNGF